MSDLSWEIKESLEDNENIPTMNSTLDEEKRRYRLAIATGSNSLYLWCDLGASAINLSTDSSGMNDLIINAIIRNFSSNNCDLQKSFRYTSSFGQLHKRSF